MYKIVRAECVGERPRWWISTLSPFGEKARELLEARGELPWPHKNTITGTHIELHLGSYKEAKWAYVSDREADPSGLGPLRAQEESNPKKAFGDTKVPLHLVPPALEIGAARALKEGGLNYGEYNWRQTAVENMTYIGAIKRHVNAYLDGEDVDPESATGKLHLEGIAACVAILLDQVYSGKLIDNRPPAGPAPSKLREKIAVDETKLKKKVTE